MAIFCLQSKGSTCCAQHVETVTGYPCQDCLLPGRPMASRPSSTFFKTLRIVWWSLWWWYNPLIYQVSPAIVQWLVKMIWRWLEKVRDYPSSAHSQNIRKKLKGRFSLISLLWSKTVRVRDDLWTSSTVSRSSTKRHVHDIFNGTI